MCRTQIGESTFFLTKIFMLREWKVLKSLFIKHQLNFVPSRFKKTFPCILFVKVEQRRHTFVDGRHTFVYSFRVLQHEVILKSVFLSSTLPKSGTRYKTTRNSIFLLIYKRITRSCNQVWRFFGFFYMF